ncbi:MAG: GIY-YIG nuclease family protein [Bacteroidales bacterium]|nr:GIY-YIG nuclease family protein [Bacteroidales bacterium]
MLKYLYVYIVNCSDNSFYTGVTNDVERRLKEHNEGINPDCYTYSRRPVELVYYEYFSDYNQAISFEKKIKGWSRAKKQALIFGDWDYLKILSRCNNSTNSNNFSK